MGLSTRGDLAPSRHVAASGGLCGVTPGRRDVPGISWVEAGALPSTLQCPGQLSRRSDPLQTSIAAGCDEEAPPRAEPPRVDPIHHPSNRPAFVEGKLRSRVRKGLAQTVVVAKTAQSLSDARAAPLTTPQQAPPTLPLQMFLEPQVTGAEAVV